MNHLMLLMAGGFGVAGGRHGQRIVTGHVGAGQQNHHLIADRQKC